MEQESMERSDRGATIAQVFGPRLDEIMRGKRMSNKELAQKIGVAPETVAEWRRGYYAPFMGRIRLAAKALGVTVNQLLGFPARGRHAAAASADAESDAPLFDGEKSESTGGKKGTCARFWLSVEELRLLQEHCEKSGETVSAFVRQVVLARVLGEKDRRLRLDLDEGRMMLLREMASIRKTTPEREAARILKGELEREWALLGDFVKEMQAKCGEPDGDEPSAAERAF